MTTKGNWQAVGSLKITAEASSDLFDIKKITTNLGKPAINIIKSGTTVELKQPLSVNTQDAEGNDLPDAQYTAGQGKVTKISKGFGTVQDAFVDEKGNLVYVFQVTASATKDSNLLPGVQISATKGTGRSGPGMGMGLNTFLFQVK